MAGLNKVSVEDINVKGKKVLVRVDFNVPLKDGVITNDNRITAALPTINKLVENGAKVVLCSHLGKPKNGPEDKFSLAPAAARLAELVNTKVVFAKDDTVVGENAKKAVAEMADGEIVVLENTRFRGAEETKNGEDFAKELSALVDNEVFVMDAFGSAHRAHASTAGVTKFVKETAVGYLMQKEITYLGNAVEVPVRPFVAILGGAKVADKLNVISNLLEKCDTLIIGGRGCNNSRILLKLNSCIGNADICRRKNPSAYNRSLLLRENVKNESVNGFKFVLRCGNRRRAIPSIIKTVPAAVDMHVEIVSRITISVNHHRMTTRGATVNTHA